MQGRALTCDACARALPEDALRRSEAGTCACGERYRFFTFPAAFAVAAPSEAASARSPEQASCYFHQNHLAVESCAHCGRLLCAICKVPALGADFCGVCLADDVVTKHYPGRAPELWMHDAVTLSLVLLPPLVFWPLTPLCAGYALYRGVKYFDTPAGPCPRRRTRLLLATLLALLELAAVATLIVMLFTRRFA